jgi:helix-turn-helix protein
VDGAVARTLWHRLEAVNAVTYFAPECREAPERLGLTGFWMGYFACRAAPMGPVAPAVVEATFYNFHPGRVRRAMPEAWSRVAPDVLVTARSAAAATALRRLLGDGAAEHLATAVVDPLRRAIAGAPGAGRPLFAANAALVPPADPVAALWQAATTLREHRGDGHVALLTGAGLDGCEVHVLFAACEGVDAKLYEQSRGWSAEDWAAAANRLASRGLLTVGGDATDAGHSLRDGVERRTDELALAPFLSLGADVVTDLLAALEPAAARITAAGEIMFPNPMGLPAVVAG